jgi:glycosyltransferase involved in cell wall biosynthesis
MYTDCAEWVSYSCRVAQEIVRQHGTAAFDILDFPEWGCEGYTHFLNQSEWNRIPAVIHLHGPLVMLASTLGWPAKNTELYRTGRHMEETCLRLADAVFSSSQCSAAWCAAEYGLDKDRIPCLHTGIDTALFYPRDTPKDVDPTIVFVGKMVSNKGVETLLEAVGVLRHEFAGLKLVLAGVGEENVMARLKGRAAKLGFGQSLVFTGYLLRDELALQLSRAHIFAAPSHYEGGPGFVYLEAMACGLPVIGCSGSGAAEVIRDGDTGFLVPPGDVPALTASLRRLLSQPQEREAMGTRARKFVTEHAESKQCVENIANFYAQTMTAVKRRGTASGSKAPT